MEITLNQLLDARDQRYARQLALVKAWPDKTLVCMTIVLPGPVKRDARSLRIAESALPTIRAALIPTYEELHDLETGYEAFFLVDAPLLEVKKHCCEIESSHPYGRLLDLDVLEPIGETVVPVSRDRVGEPPRRCLLCDRPVRECMRSKAHSYGEISEAIDRILGYAEKL